VSLLCVAAGFYRSEFCVRRSKWSLTALTITLLLASVLAIMSNVIGPHLQFVGDGGLLLNTVSGWITSVAVTRIAFFLAHQSDLFTRKLLVVGSSQSALRIQNMISSEGGQLCHLIGNVVLSAGRGATPALSAFDISELRREKIWAVVFAKDAAASVTRENFLAHLMSLKHFRRAYVFDEAGFCENHLQRLDPDALPQDWRQVLPKITDQRWVNLAYRSIDIVTSSVLLILTLPLFLLIALAIRIESSGPVFCSQARLGQYGRRFMLHRFRCQIGHSDSVTNLPWAARTCRPQGKTVGRFMRRFHFDALPQLVNVMFGEMSLIGPRAEQPHDAERFSKLIPHYSERLCLKPGLTGWAQVRHPYKTTRENARMSLAYDLFYIKHRSFLLQLMIVVETGRMILFRKGEH